MPSLSPKTGYRLAAGTEADPLWKDSTNSYINDAVLTSATFTADTTVTLQTIKQWTVTINQPNEVYGSISNYEPTVIVDNNTTLADIVKDIVFTPSVTDGYMLTGWNVDEVQVSNANLSTIYITKDVSISPIIAPFNYKISEINTTKAAVSNVAENDQVTYGTDINFTVIPETKATTYSVYYKVSDGESKQLTVTSDNSYTIPGNEIIGDVVIEVVAKTYYQITFRADSNSTMTELTAYAWEGIEGLFSTIEGLGNSDYKFESSDIKSDLSANDTYRLAADNIDEPLWNDGSNSFTTIALIFEDSFTSDVTYTANTIKQYKVTFIAGENGGITDTTEYIIDTGKSLTELPTPAPNDNYSFKAWSINGTEYNDNDLKAVVIIADTEVTAVFEPSKYTINFAETTFGSFDSISGLTDDGYATYLTDVTFTFTPNEEQRIESVYYTVNGVEMTDLVDNGNGNYTIPGESITGAINVITSTQETKVFSFLTSDSAIGSVEGVTSFILDLNSFLTPDRFDTVTVIPNTGYTFTEWMVSPDDTVSPSAIVVPTEVPADRNISFLAQYQLTDFNVTDADNAIEVIHGLDGGYAHMGTDLVIKIRDEIVAAGLTYTIGDGEPVALTPNGNNTFTIRGNEIVDDITINANVIDGTLMFIYKEDYLGDATTAMSADKKIAVITTDILPSGNFATLDGKEFFYSDRYGAYLMIVDVGESDSSMIAKLTINENSSTRYIDYSGDLNGTGTVTAGDADMINDILKNRWSYVVTDRELLMLDVEQTESNKRIYTSDVVWILKKSIGLDE